MEVATRATVGEMSGTYAHSRERLRRGDRLRARINVVKATLCAVTVAYASMAVADGPREADPPPNEEVFTLEGLDNTSRDAESSTRAETSPWTTLTDNLRFNVDALSRVESTRRRGKASGLNAVGFDIHKVFSDSEADIGTLLLQPYLVRRDNALMIMPHVEDDDDWEIEFHQFYFNLTRWGRGRTNLRVGHFFLPYGLEPLNDTHFTVYQVLTMPNLGEKMDWGVSLNGALPLFDYEVSLTQGSGMEYTNVGKNYAITGRIGTPSDRNFVLGLSGFYGQILDPHRLHRWHAGLRPPSRVDRVLGRTPGMGRGDDNLIRRIRAGIDVTWIINQFTLKGEASVGRDFNQDVFNSLIELDWTSADQKFTVYLQGIYLGQRGHRGWDEDVIARLGALWNINEHWSVSGQYSQDLETLGSRPEDAIFTLQMRYRF